MPHDPEAVALAVLWAVLGVAFVAAVVLLVCSSVLGRRDARLMEAWREDRKRQAAALDATIALNEGWRNGAA